MVKPLALFFDSIEVANFVSYDGQDKLVLNDGVHHHFIPHSLFKGRRSIHVLEVAKWVEDRLFPKNRMGATEILTDMGLDEYNTYEIAIQTRASMMEDGWWLQFYESDTFRGNTIRGIFGIPEKTQEEFLLEADKINSDNYYEHVNIVLSSCPWYDDYRAGKLTSCVMDITML